MRQAEAEWDSHDDRDPDDERDEQHHVRAARRDEVREAGGAEVVAERLGERVVLAEDHPSGEGLLLAFEPRVDATLGAGAEGVDRGAAGAAGGADLVRLEDRVDVAAALEGLAGAEGSEGALRRDLVADVERRGLRPPRDAELHGVAVWRLDREDADAEGPLAWGFEDVASDGRSGLRRERRAVQGGQPRVGDAPPRSAWRATAALRTAGHGQSRPAASGVRRPRVTSAVSASAAVSAASAHGHRGPVRRPATSAPSTRCRGYTAMRSRSTRVRRAKLDRVLTPAPAHAATRGGPRRCPGHRRARRPSRSRRARRGSRGWPGPWRGRCRRGRRAARASRC